MSKKERTFAIYSLFLLWKSGWRREQITELIQCFDGCNNVQQDWKWNTYLFDSFFIINEFKQGISFE